MRGAIRADAVFLNCPYDRQYRPLFRALVFVVFDCGFLPRCALEDGNSSVVRIDKIKRIIRQSKYSVHDISRTQLHWKTRLPRFNVPLELGLVLGAKTYGAGVQRKKRCLVLDREPRRFRDFISDIAGQDVCGHNNDPKAVIKCVRDWLSTVSRRVTIPGSREVWTRYIGFVDELPRLCKELKWDPGKLLFIELSHLIQSWLEDRDRIA